MLTVSCCEVTVENEDEHGNDHEGERYDPEHIDQPRDDVVGELEPPVLIGVVEESEDELDKVKDQSKQNVDSGGNPDDGSSPGGDNDGSSPGGGNGGSSDESSLCGGNGADNDGSSPGGGNGSDNSDNGLSGGGNEERSSHGSNGGGNELADDDRAGMAAPGSNAVIDLTGSDDEGKG